MSLRLTSLGSFFRSVWGTIVTKWIVTTHTYLLGWYGHRVSDAPARESAESAIAPRDRVLADLEALLVARLGKVGRTKLVKLIYLIDERFYSHHGRTLTGHVYIYDDWGPNAVGHAIAKVGDELRDEKVVDIEPDPHAPTGHGFLYRPGEAISAYGEVSEPGREVVEDILREYGHMSRDQITKASKATRPFASHPAKYERLQMTTLEDSATAALLRLSKEAEDFPASDSTDSEPDDLSWEERPGSWASDSQSRVLREVST